MDQDDFRRVALSLPEAEEKAHFGKADFRVRNRIFATLPSPGIGVVKLTRDEQALLVEAEPAIFSPVKGGWGRQGWTQVSLEATDDATLRSALMMGWRNVAPKKLAKVQAPNLG